MENQEQLALDCASWSSLVQDRRDIRSKHTSQTAITAELIVEHDGHRKSVKTRRRTAFAIWICNIELNMLHKTWWIMQRHLESASAVHANLV